MSQKISHKSPLKQNGQILQRGVFFFLNSERVLSQKKKNNMNASEITRSLS